VAVGFLCICIVRKQLLCPTQEFLLTLKSTERSSGIAALQAVNWPLLLENILVYGMGFVVFPILNGAVAQISYVADINSGLRDVITQAFCMSALLVVIAVTILTNKPINCKKFTIILVPVVVTALSITPLFWDNTPFSSSIIIKCIYVIYASIIWVSLAEKAYAKPEKTVFFFGSLGFPALSLLIGRELGASLSAANQLNFGTMAGFSIGAIWLILMIGMLLLGLFFKNKNKQLAGLQTATARAENALAPASQTDKYLSFSRNSSLSKRETEILIEFAQGRSAIYISKILSISEYTVKSHLRRIYAKANVHNRQELLDLIEESEAARFT
jgi:DNA-binding CsgD family transcriptional regulator